MKKISSAVINFNTPVVQQHLFYGHVHYSFQEMETIIYFYFVFK